MSHDKGQWLISYPALDSRSSYSQRQNEFYSPDKRSNKYEINWALPFFFEFHDSISCDRGFPSNPRTWIWNNRPNSCGRLCRLLLLRYSSERLIRSPISAGKLRNLFDDKSSFCNEISLPMSAGILVKLLSLSFRLVRKSKLQSFGLKFLILLKNSKPVHFELPSSLSPALWFKRFLFRILVSLFSFCIFQLNSS